MQDIIIRNNILDLDIIKTQLKENLYFLKNKKRQELPQFSIASDEKLSLYEYLEHIISIKDFKYFNTIFHSLENGQAEFYVSEMKLIKMEYNYYYEDDANEDSKTCNVMKSM